MRIRFIELFGGIGGFRYGLEKAKGFKCVWYCDIDKHATAVYNINFNEEHEPSDAKSVEPKDIPDFDMLTAGFPCQSFSITGKRKGFDDTRGSLFYEIVRIASERRPRYLLLENVPGILSNDGGRTYATILDTLSELGYRIQWQVLNSKDFGVPQSRKRPFVVGSPRGECPPKVFPIGQGEGLSDQETEREQGKELELQGQVVPTIRKTYHKGYQSSGPLISSAIDARYGALRNQGEPYILHNVYGGYGEDQVRVFEGETPAIRTPKGGGHLPLLLDFYNNRVRANQNLVGTLMGGGHGPKRDGTALAITLANRSRYEQGVNRTPAQKDGLSRALNSAGDQGILKDMQIRRLTPTECERLQGFPDGWTMYGSPNGSTYKVSDTQRYKLLGNAVTTNVIGAIGRILARAIKEDHE